MLLVVARKPPTEDRTDRWGMRHVASLIEQDVKDVLRAMPLGDIATINGRLVIRKRVRQGMVGCDEWDVDALRMTLDAALEELLPGKGRCLLKGDL